MCFKVFFSLDKPSSANPPGIFAVEISAFSLAVLAYSSAFVGGSDIMAYLNLKISYRSG